MGHRFDWLIKPERVCDSRISAAFLQRESRASHCVGAFVALAFPADGTRSFRQGDVGLCSPGAGSQVAVMR
ncbi:hypothetical protein CHELA40_11020 [Chelatococcus asaccharovorans]|nr:hypothetical protein CHELA40_11020 [Chelatococcus asaccharovorans]CAH1685579.1 hypothetical protein CHELA17_64577 [Chelatococcus asaccharovorans]